MTRDEKFLLALGGSLSMKGFGYIIKAVELAREDPAITDAMVKRLYPEIAEHFGTTPTGAERCIRIQLEDIYRRKENLPAEMKSKNGARMTNKEFLARFLKMTENPCET